MLQFEEFKGRIAVITGGSDGLGRDLCQSLVAQGCQVWFCARNSEHGQQAEKTMGSLSHFCQADLSDPDQIDRFADRVQAHCGTIDYLVNNVALDDRVLFEDLTADACDRIWNTNLRSTLLTSRVFLPLLKAGAGKSIVNMGTTNYLLGLTPFTLYNATKSGLVGFTRSLAREIGKDGIRVNMVSPGWVMTDKQLRQHVTIKDQEELIRDQSLKFLLSPSDVTPAILFLLSSLSGAITGQNIVVDGGKYMQ